MNDKDFRWQTWKDDNRYGELLNRRAKGVLPEMESAKSTGKRLVSLVREGDHLADVGCGCGHYLPTFRRLILAAFTYTGVDATPGYLELARETFAGVPGVSFKLADVTGMPFADESFDVVVSANMLLHLPGIAKALSELVRISRRTVLIRTLVGERSFVVKEVKPGPDGNPGDEFERDGLPRKYSYFNIYSRAYVEHLLSLLPTVKSVSITPDDEFDSENLNADNTMDSLDSLRTRSRGGVQVLGDIILPWAFIEIRTNS